MGKPELYEMSALIDDTMQKEKGLMHPNAKISSSQNKG
jgi:hypothetical protein